MDDNIAQTESILRIVQAIDDSTIMLPEFQRDFRWELDQTYDLFDSLARDIFIGTIIYGKPSFAITCRELDTRPRKGNGSRAKLKYNSYTDDQINKMIKNKNFRIVLDGQQRLTALYRAVRGYDEVYLILKENATGNDLESIMEGFSGDERDDRICIRISDAYKRESENLLDDDMMPFFDKSRYAREQRNSWIQDENLAKQNLRTYLQAVRLLTDLLKKEKLVTYYLLDMNIEKFCTFFERSNSS